MVILSNRVDDFEERSFLIHGIDEVERENIDDVVIGIIKDKLNTYLTYDIQRSHRIGIIKDKLNTYLTYDIQRSHRIGIIKDKLNTYLT